MKYWFAIMTDYSLVFPSFIQIDDSTAKIRTCGLFVSPGISPQVLVPEVPNYLPTQS